MHYTLVYRYFTLCSHWTKFYRELVTLIEIVIQHHLQISALRSFQIGFIKPTLATVEKKSSWLVLPQLWLISLQIRTNIRNDMKSTLNCCKLQVIFESKGKLSNMFRFKDRVHYDLVSGVFMNTLVVEAILPEMVRQRGA